MVFLYMQCCKCLWLDIKMLTFTRFQLMMLCLSVYIPGIGCKTPRRSGAVNPDVLPACSLWRSALVLIFRVSHLFLSSLS